MIRRAAQALCLALLLAAGLAAQSQPALPALTDPVNDLAQVIDSASAAELDRIIRSLHTGTGDVIVVATVPSIGTYGSIEEYAVRLFESAGIGARANDNGLLVLVAVEDRKVRIEVGYGLEEFITDGYAGEVIRTRLLPAFREGSYGQGLVAGVRQLAVRLAEGRGTTLSDLPAPPQPTRRPHRPSSSTARTILTVLVILFLVIAANRNQGGPGVRRRGRHGMWSGWYGGVGGFGGGFGSGGFRGGGFGGGGFGGGGFGGFGGGRSGGGGASGGW
ncbi:MAG: hypothetical protein AMXMBFR57_20670 [Acidimicrobiia bacterium]